jgi:AcrR family transcriptional regulator
VSAAPRRLGRPPSVDSAETREQILQAARRAFALRGFDATTNKEVAKAVGITTGAIYHYFGSKVELYAAVYEEVQEIVYGEFEKAVTEHATFVDRFCSVLDSAVAVNRQDPSIAGFVVGVAAEAQRHPQLAPLVEPYRRRGRVFLNRLVEEAAANGEFADHVDPRAVLDMISAVLGGLATFSTTSGDSDRHRAATELVKQMVRGTLLSES